MIGNAFFLIHIQRKLNKYTSVNDANKRNISANNECAIKKSFIYNFALQSSKANKKSKRAHTTKKKQFIIRSDSAHSPPPVNL